MKKIKGEGEIVPPIIIGCMTAIFFAEFFLFLNTVIVNVTRSAMHARAFAVNLFFIHAMGDAVSPSILCFVCDRFGREYGSSR